jgi:hypothetical protein
MHAGYLLHATIQDPTLCTTNYCNVNGPKISGQFISCMQLNTGHNYADHTTLGSSYEI